MVNDVPDVRQQLEELIAAVDRRVADITRSGEAAIARDAATLRTRAVARLAELVEATKRADSTSTTAPV